MTDALFKYFGTDKDKLNWFANGQVLLTPPIYFNDPWDFLVRSEPYTDKELDVEAKKQGISLELIRKVAMVPDYLLAESLYLQEEISKLVGVVSLAEEPLNRRMWSIFGDSHRGFVAEFQHIESDPQCGKRIRRGPFRDAVKVAYARSQPQLKRNLSNMADVVCSKPIDWEYEQEWRVIESFEKSARGQTAGGEERHLLRFQPSQLIRVVLGLRVSPTVKATLHEMLVQPEFQHVRRSEVVINLTSTELGMRDLPK